LAAFDRPLDVLRAAFEFSDASCGDRDLLQHLWGQDRLGAGQRLFDRLACAVKDVGVAGRLAGDEAVGEARDGVDDDAIGRAADRVGAEGDAGGFGDDHALDDNGGDVRLRQAVVFAVGVEFGREGGVPDVGDAHGDVARGDVQVARELTGEGVAERVFFRRAGADGEFGVGRKEAREFGGDFGADFGFHGHVRGRLVGAFAEVEGARRDDEPRRHAEACRLQAAQARRLAAV